MTRWHVTCASAQENEANALAWSMRLNEPGNPIAEGDEVVVDICDDVAPGKLYVTDGPLQSVQPECDDAESAS